MPNAQCPIPNAMIRISKFLLLLLIPLTLAVIIGSQKYIQAQDIQAQGIQAQDIQAQDIQAQIPNQQLSQSQTPNSQAASSRAEIVAKVTQGPGNITVTPDGRIIVSLHQFYETQNRVVEVSKDGKLTPFPNVEWSQGRDNKGVGLDAVLGIQSDPNGVVWMLDNGMRGGLTPQLVGWNTRTNKLEEVISLPSPATTADSFLNDLAVDFTNQVVYITDTENKKPALIVVDLSEGKARRVLTGDVSVKPEDVDLIVEGKPTQRKQPDGTLIKPRVGANPIALDAKNEWLYYGPMNGKRLYRIRTADLRNPKLNDEDLAKRVEDYAAKPNCDGISIDRENNIYITDLAANAIGVIRSDRPSVGNAQTKPSYEQLVSEPWMSWIDALSFGPDGYLYSVINQLHRTPALNGGKNDTKPPFLIIRVKPLADGIVGR